MGLKPNRSNKFTTGLCNTFRGTTSRVLFFEIDGEEDVTRFYQIIETIYRQHHLDFIMHRTGSGGMHFLSPTMISLEEWKEIMKHLKGINPKCPMTTLRVEPNKYVNEADIWYRSSEERYRKTDPYSDEVIDMNTVRNSAEMCNYLNHIWNTTFKGNVNTEIKVVRYPLPLMEPPC